jgi:hypothetical protein
VRGEDGGGSLMATITHARLRASQGDVRGARRILDAILLDRPDDVEALALRGSLDGVAERAGAEEPDEIPAVPVGAEPQALRKRFRLVLGAAGGPPSRRVARRLEEILRRIEEQRRTDRAR